MHKKKILIFIFFSSLLGCGYTPLYLGLSGIDLRINLNNVSGDRDLNNNIKSNINEYTEKESDNVFTVNVKSIFEKSIILKDATGTATDYELIATVNFDVTSKGINKIISLKETTKVKKISNAFDEETYEKNIKKNFASSISKRFILQLSQIK